MGAHGLSLRPQLLCSAGSILIDSLSHLELHPSSTPDHATSGNSADLSTLHFLICDGEGPGESLSLGIGSVSPVLRFGDANSLAVESICQQEKAFAIQYSLSQASMSSPGRLSTYLFCRFPLSSLLRRPPAHFQKTPPQLLQQWLRAAAVRRGPGRLGPLSRHSASSKSHSLQVPAPAAAGKQEMLSPYGKQTCPSISQAPSIKANNMHPPIPQLPARRWRVGALEISPSLSFLQVIHPLNENHCW